MKTYTKVAKIQSNATFNQSVKMGVDNDSLPHIIKSLTDIYQDGYLAAAREYISNAYDATVKRMGATSSFGTVLDRAIEVTLPTPLNPIFIIRDYGTGMCRQILADVFPKYGASTKRDNDVEAGGFGLGAKSALSIVSSFIVTSVFNHKKNTVIIQKDEDGVGVANFLDEQDTTEDNGTVISITLPDPERLSRLFSDSNLLLGFPPNSIRIDGRMHMNSVYDVEKFSAVENGWVLNNLVNWSRSSSNRLRKNYGEKIILVGPIAYSFHRNQLGDAYTELPATYNMMDDYSVLNLPINSVDLTPARDTLIFSDRTRKAIIEGSKKLYEDVFRMMEKALSEAETKFDAVELVEGFRNSGVSGDYEWKYKDEVVPARSFAVAKGVKSWFSAPGFKTSLHTFTGPCSSANMVVVYGVKDSAEAADLNRFRKDFETKHSKVTPHMNLVFTTAGKDDLDGWAEFVVSGGCFSVDEFRVEGAGYRKVINDERRAMRAATSTRGHTIVSMPVSVLSPSHYLSERPLVVSRPASDFSATEVVVYIRVDETNKDSLSHQFAVNTSSKSKTYEVLQTLNLLLRFLNEVYGENVSVIRIPANVKVDNVRKIIPNLISMDEAVPKAVKAHADKGAVDYLQLRFDEVSVHEIEWTVMVDVEKVENKEVAEWIASAASYVRTHRSYEQRRQRNSRENFIKLIKLKMCATAFADHLQKLEEVKFWNIPILAGISRDTGLSEDIVEYVNFKHPAA